jgi:outer membrane protein assembly factor BamB/tRNA A-37 threonylcarbamoyl transferase component Bud32
MEPLTAEDPRMVGPYPLRARLGSGGMGRVYLGFSHAGRAMAVKVIHPQLAQDWEFRERFRREVDTARKVSGLFTAPLVAADVDGDPPWLATAFVPGPSLGDVVSAHGPLPEPALWQLAGGLAEALSNIHASGVLHRDLKPTNVLLATDGPRVIDFGVARTLDRAVLTATGMVVGTPAFMSPEQANGLPAREASDIFSFGGVLAYAATGTPPFGDGIPAAVMYRIVHDRPALDGMPRQFAELVAGCLAKSPGDRPEVSRLAETIMSRALRDPATSPASFWTDAVAELIRAFQERLEVVTSLDGKPCPTATPRAARKPKHAKRRGRGDEEYRREPVLAALKAPQPAPHAGAPDDSGGNRSRGLLPAGLLPPTMSRRALLGVTGVAAAALAAGGWELSRSWNSTAIKRASAAAGTAARRAGSLAWSFQTGGQVEADLTVSNGVVYASSHDHKVYALRASDGARLWAYPTRGVIDGGAAVAYKMVFVGGRDTRIYALNASNGALVWDFATGSPVASDPAVAAGVVYTGNDGGHVYALRATDGGMLWAFTANGVVESRLTVSGDAVYTSGGRYMYALRARDGSMIWSFPANDAVLPPVLADGVVFFGSLDGHVYAVRASDGARLWTYQAGAILSNAIVAAGVVYVGGEDFNVYALAARDGAKLWEFPATGSISGLTAAGGVVYAGSADNNLYALQARDGSKLWDFPAHGNVYSGPAAAGGMVYFGSDDHTVYAVRS